MIHSPNLRKAHLQERASEAFSEQVSQTVSQIRDSLRDSPVHLNLSADEVFVVKHHDNRMENYSFRSRIPDLTKESFKSLFPGNV